MFTHARKFIGALLLVAMLATMGGGAVFAQDIAATPGSGPGVAVQPVNGMVTIPANSWQWYIFRSQVPVDVDAEGNDIVTDPRDATIDATLYTESQNIGFEVWSSNDYNNWLNSSDFDPLGRGTENDFMNEDPLFWRGSFETNDNYYLIVKNSGQSAATYSLDITGHLRFPTEMTLDSTMDSMMPSMMDSAMDSQAMSEDAVMSTGEMALTVDDAAETMTEEMTTSAANVGTGPESALMPTDGFVQIAPNSWQWYSFRSQLPVNVDSEGNDVVTNPEDATINATLRTLSGNVDFEVWSRNDLNNWRNSSDFDPLGRGTENDFMNGDPLFWKGSFQANDVYYLIVKNNTAQPATYSLDITGNVSFPSTSTLAVN